MELTALGSDVITNICYFLPYISIISLRWTCKRLRDFNFIKIRFKDIVIHRLKLLGAGDLQEAIVKYEHYISGGFMLQCMYNENWIGDIDVYCCSKYEDYFPEHYKKKPKGKDAIRLGFLYEWLKSKNQEITVCANHYDGTPLTSRVYQMFKCKSAVGLTEISRREAVEINNQNELYKLNHIIVHKFQTVKEAVHEFFDLSVCKVIYDGDKVFVQNLDKMIKRISTVAIETPKYCGINSLRTTTFMRMLKYQKRGFVIENFDKFYEVLCKYLWNLSTYEASTSLSLLYAMEDEDLLKYPEIKMWMNHVHQNKK